MEHPAALPFGRNAFVAAHCYEEKANLTAVSVAVLYYVRWYVVQCGVLASAGPRIGLSNVCPDSLGLKVRVLLISHNAVGKSLELRSEDYVDCRESRYLAL